MKTKPLNYYLRSTDNGQENQSTSNDTVVNQQSVQTLQEEIHAALLDQQVHPPTVQQDQTEQLVHPPTVQQDQIEQQVHPPTEQQDQTEQQVYPPTVQQDQIEQQVHHSTVQQDQIEQQMHIPTVQQDQTEQQVVMRLYLFVWPKSLLIVIYIIKSLYSMVKINLEYFYCITYDSIFVV